jgi:hypothetical protein
VRLFPPLVLTLLCLAVTPAQSPPAPTPRFGARVEVVKVSILVRGAEGPVLGLRAADFEVRDNGVRQEVERVLFEELPLDVILAFDVSGIDTEIRPLSQLAGGFCRRRRSVVPGLDPR